MGAGRPAPPHAFQAAPTPTRTRNSSQSEPERKTDTASRRSATCAEARVNRNRDQRSCNRVESLKLPRSRCKMLRSFVEELGAISCEAALHGFDSEYVAQFRRSALPGPVWRRG